jgi:hypothetical protein
MNGIELRVEDNRARKRNRNENRELMNQDQDGNLEKKSDRERNAQLKRTQNEQFQDVKERRESNRTSMTNLAEKRSSECNRDQITIGTNRNQIESNGGYANEKGRTIQARERIPSKQKNEKQASPRVPFTSKGAKFKSKRRAKKSLHDQANERAKSAQTPHQLGQRHLDRDLLVRKNRKELKRNTRSSTTCTQIIENPVEAKRSMLHCKGAC